MNTSLVKCSGIGDVIEELIALGEAEIEGTNSIVSSQNMIINLPTDSRHSTAAPTQTASSKGM